MCLTCWKIVLESEKAVHPHKKDEHNPDMQLHILSGNFFQMQSASKAGILGMTKKFKRCETTEDRPEGF